MVHLFLQSHQFHDGRAEITGSDHQHIARVLRLRVGAEIVLLDNLGNAFAAEIVTIENSKTQAAIVGRAEVPDEPTLRLTVAQALGKGEKFDQVLQHGTEIGVSHFVPLVTERCVGDVPPERVPARLARWQSIVKGASEQCGRRRMPTIESPRPFRDMASALNCRQDRGLMLHPDPSAVPLSQALRRPEAPESVVIFVGPEGGWSPSEVALAARTGLTLVSLGARILRTETAALVAGSQILYEAESCR